MWESIQYVNNKWTLSAVIVIAILAFLKSWVNKTERLLVTLPEDKRIWIVILKYVGNFILLLILLSSFIAVGVAILPTLEKILAELAVPSEKKSTILISNDTEKKCPENYSDNPNATIDCLLKVK